MEKEEKNNIFGKNIIYLCKRKGISRRQLAKDIGITEISMSRYIHSVRIPKYQIVSLIAAYFNTTVEKLTTIDLTIESNDLNIIDIEDKSVDDKYFDLLYYNIKEISDKLNREQKLKLISALL